MNIGRFLGLGTVLRADLFVAPIMFASFILQTQAFAADTSTRGSVAQFRPTISESRLNVQGQMLLGSQYVSDETDEGSNVNFGFGLKLNYKFLDSLELRSETRLNFSQERFQAQIDDDEFADGFSVKEAVAAWSPLTQVEIGAGAVNQHEFLEAPLLISNRSFPGAYQQLLFGEVDRNFVQFRLSQSIPTSRSFDSDRIEKEKTPYFFTEGVKLGVRPNKHIQFIPFYQRFRYTDLPSVVAYNGSFRGNTVADATPTNSRFAFDFEGYVAGLRVALDPTSDLSLFGEFQGIENTKAPEGFNSGQLGKAGLRVQLGQVVVEPVVGTFFNESDTSPAAYNSAHTGHNNREGMVYAFDLTFDKYNFKIASELVDARIVNPAQRQSDMDYFSISLETLYVEF